LGHLLPNDVTEDTIAERLKLFCDVRQSRALLARARAIKAGKTLEMADGPSQVERDDRMRLGVTNEGFPNPFADSILQQWLYTYDVAADVAAALRNQPMMVD
jgi:hypothetical protein